MSRDLPYFKFFTGEWLNGDVTLLELELQGQFINVCAWYWHKECRLSLKQVDRKFGAIVDLIEEGLIEVEDDEIVIKFLDEQFSEFKSRKKQLSDAGKKGAQIKKDKAIQQPPLQLPLQLPLNNPSTTIEDKSKIREDKSKSKSIEERLDQFEKLALAFTSEYGIDLIEEFLSYWTEHSPNDKKMRFEKQTSFAVGRRLGTWKQNQKKYGSQGNSKDNRATTTKAGRQNFD